MKSKDKLNEIGKIRSKSIKDFGDQWDLYNNNKGYHESEDLLKDIIEPLMSIEEFEGSVIAEVGSGNGRIINMISSSKAKKIYAIEPSSGYKYIEQKIANNKYNIKVINKSGEEFTTSEKLDIILSIGVLHHIPNPDPVLKNCKNNLKKGGTILIWLYGKEGNGIYLLLINIIRVFTTRMPDIFLRYLVNLIYIPLSIYTFISRRVKTPMRDYMLNVIGKMDKYSQKQVIFDQLNPIYSKYYERHEVFELLHRNGFKNIEIHRRHGYSYTAKASNI